MTKFSKKIYDTSTIKIENLEILILRKAVRKIYLRIATNDGKIHLIAPRKTSSHYLKSLLIDKLPWIKKHYQKFSKNNVNNINFQNGETIDFFGNKYILEIILNQEKQIIHTNYKDKITISIAKELNQEDIKKLLHQFYRQELIKVIVPMVYKWQKIMNLKSNFIGIKKMKTKWGSCNFKKARLWFSSELAKKPMEAIEYVVVHELGHLIEPSHNKKFVAVMNRFLPDWQDCKRKLS
jgi:hypothetical protein